MEYQKYMEAVMLHLVELSAPLTPRGGAAAGDVFGMIQVVICGAQEAYEEFVKDTNAPVDAKSKEAVNQYKYKEAVMLDLGELSDYNTTPHLSCFHREAA